jgi:DNA replication protein DnaC
MPGELEKLKDYMTRLHINEAAAVVAEMLMDAQVKETSYQSFLITLMEHEIKKREEKQLGRLYKLASFPECKTLDDFDLDEQDSLSKKQLQQLKELLWLEQAYTLILLGPPGSGI